MYIYYIYIILYINLNPAIHYASKLCIIGRFRYNGFALLDVLTFFKLCLKLGS